MEDFSSYPFLNIDQAGRFLGQSSSFVLTHCRKNSPRLPRIPASFFGRSYRFKLADLQAYLDEHFKPVVTVTEAPAETAKQ